MGYSMHVYIIHRETYGLHREEWLSHNPAEFCVCCLQAVLRGLLKWTETCFFRTSTLILTLALKPMSLACVSHGKTITSLRVQTGQDQNRKYSFIKTSSHSSGTLLKCFLNAVSSNITVLTYLTWWGRKKTNSCCSSRTGNELNGRNLCAVLFFFFFLVCLLRIFVYLRFPGGNSRLGARSARVSDCVRDTPSLHVSQSACSTLSSWSVLNRKGRL